jgi:hypothetical protein
LAFPNLLAENLEIASRSKLTPQVERPSARLLQSLLARPNCQQTENDPPTKVRISLGLFLFRA